MPTLIEPIYICQPEEIELMAEAAEGYLARGDFESMEAVLYGLAQVEPNSPWILSSLGYAQHQLGKLEDAEQSYRRAIDLSEKPHPMSSVNLIGIYLAQHRVDEAIEQLARVIESGDRSEPVAVAVARFANLLADYGIGVDERPAKKRQPRAKPATKKSKAKATGRTRTAKPKPTPARSAKPRHKPATRTKRR